MPSRVKRQPMNILYVTAPVPAPAVPPRVGDESSPEEVKYLTRIARNKLGLPRSFPGKDIYQTTRGSQHKNLTAS